MDSQTYDEDTLTGPFIGFVVGTVLFGLTILQASQYYFQFPKDTLFCKLKVGTVCALDVSHFVFSVSLFHANFISTRWRASGSGVLVKNDWSLKALSMTQTLLIVLVQIIYLQRIYTLSNIPALNKKTFTRIMNAVICLIGLCAICIGAVFCYKVQNVRVAFTAADSGDQSWVIYLGFGAAACLDAIIAALTCFVLHKNRRDIGLGYISRRSNRLLLSLFRYSLATGILTTLAATLVIVLYLERPTTTDYLSVTFITTRLYTNSVLSFVQNVRRQLNNQDTSGTTGMKAPAEIVFTRRPENHRRHPDVEAPLVLITDSDSEFDANSQHLSVYSPYYSSLQARKRQIEELEEIRNNLRSSLSPTLNIWFKGSINRRSSL
ncbi:hypothetical protein AGABI1DRAFT_131492 [Agaricus bisporus var. burnettii JB137-S8]|uniref:DUF6534 domain-containing protein n=1 Tax=Agaricus bisporus var. burnettii (strain JB137-S8 / ATCC MYA-4627 / FGSC 10392) TaxID=597362 RepID=K5WZX9_AGABU|nr:uncharacterized protein AGABI1DRAFT_131492 [Agaricus bisporus var. burnettii JB137-S8]EKM76172.1 hypothetical protein AGABI1DRAFT_131492 [Agaricus bisporus var. burnettii JB137-S8]